MINRIKATVNGLLAVVVDYDYGDPGVQTVIIFVFFLFGRGHPSPNPRPACLRISAGRQRGTLGKILLNLFSKLL